MKRKIIAFGLASVVTLMSIMPTVTYATTYVVDGFTNNGNKNGSYVGTGTRVDEESSSSGSSSKGDMTVILNLPTDPIVNGCVLRCLNRQTDTAVGLYQPKLSDVPGLVPWIMNNRKYSAVYTGLFNQKWKSGQNNEITEDTTPDTKERELAILGRDIVQIGTERKYESANYLLNSDSPVPQSVAVMAIYKALGTNIIKVIDTKTYDNGKEVLPIGQTPFLELAGDGHLYINNKNYYYDVYLSRTFQKDYLDLAVNEGIVGVRPSEVTPEQYEADHTIDSVKKVDFLVWLKRMLYLQGEPILNDTETMMLLSAYGAKLPLGLGEEESQSIQFLMARGIIPPDTTDYFDDITTSEMLTILMRAKDKDSRLDFKTIEIKYDTDLLELGYYPVEMEVNDSGIQKIGYSTEAIATASYYDYLIKIDSNTEYVGNDGNRQYSVVLVDASNTSSLVAGQIYVGEQDGFYHFRVPVAQDKPMLMRLSKLENSANKSLTIEAGGGRYQVIDGKMTRTPFKLADTEYIDKEMKISGQKGLSDNVYLAERTSIDVLFTNDDDVTVKLPKNNSVSYNKTTTTDGAIIYKFTVIGNYDDPISKVKDCIKYSVGSRESAVGYVKTGNSYMISTKILDKILPGTGDMYESLSVEEVTPNKVYRVMTRRSAMLIDKDAKVAYSTQVFLRLDAGDKSPLITKVKDGVDQEWLIDARLLKPILGDIELSMSEKGAIVNAGSLSTKRPFQAKTITSLVGVQKGLQFNYIVRGGKHIMMLEGNYPLSNNVVFMTPTADYLVNFKTKGSESLKSISTYSNDKFQEQFGVKLPDSIEVRLFALGHNGTAIKTGMCNGAPSGITYDSTLGYLYTIPDKSNYSHSHPIQIYRDGTNFYNANLPTTNKTNDCQLPSGLLDRQIAGMSTPFETKTVSRDTTSYKCASTGLLNSILSAGENYDRISADCKAIVTGTCLFDTNPNGGSYWWAYLDGTPIYNIHAGLQSDTGRRMGDLFVLVGDSIELDPATEEQNALSKALDAIFSMGAGIANLFDWENMNFFEMLKTAEDITTVLYIIVLDIIPRLMLFDFFALASLALIARYQVVISFCEAVFDPFKILSFGLLDVHRARPLPLWVSTFFGAVLLGMLNNETFIEIINWIIRAFSGILS